MQEIHLKMGSIQLISILGVLSGMGGPNRRTKEAQGFVCTYMVNMCK